MFRHNWEWYFIIIFVERAKGIQGVHMNEPSVGHNIDDPSLSLDGVTLNESYINTRQVNDRSN